MTLNCVDYYVDICFYSFMMLLTAADCDRWK